MTTKSLLVMCVLVARELATVGRLNGTSVPSYAGFFTVNKTLNSNMFFWFFPSQVSVIAGFSCAFLSLLCLSIGGHYVITMSSCPVVCPDVPCQHGLVRGRASSLNPVHSCSVMEKSLKVAANSIFVPYYVRGVIKVYT